MNQPNASNWLDRGDPPEPILARVLAYYFDRDRRADAEMLQEWATQVLGMVAADATEVNIGGFLAALEDQLLITAQTKPHRRAVGIALWHIAKCALVRDEASRRAVEPHNSETAT
jgi:hypothetical protein